jgi:zinc/manganese transport system ATP-binding protein
MSALLRFHNLTLGYDRHPAVHHLSGEIAAGSLIALVGPNGAGKSSLLKAIAGELAPMEGRLEMHGISKRDVAWLTQQ